MADTRWISGKVAHMFDNAVSFAKKGAVAGFLVGAAVGAFVAFAPVAGLTFGGALAVSAVYGAGSSMAGMLGGGLFGAAKGLITRRKPDSEQIIRDAEECGRIAPVPSNALDLEKTQQQQQEVAARPRHDTNPALTSRAVQAEFAPHTSQPNQPQSEPKNEQSVQQLRAMTDVLNEMHHNGAAEKQGNWQQRVSEQDAMAAERSR